MNNSLGEASVTGVGSDAYNIDELRVDASTFTDDTENSDPTTAIPQATESPEAEIEVPETSTEQVRIQVGLFEALKMDLESTGQNALAGYNEFRVTNEARAAQKADQVVDSVVRFTKGAIATVIRNFPAMKVGSAVGLGAFAGQQAVEGLKAHSAAVNATMAPVGEIVSAATPILESATPMLQTAGEVAKIGAEVATGMAVGGVLLAEGYTFAKGFVGKGMETFRGASNEVGQITDSAVDGLAKIAFGPGAEIVKIAVVGTTLDLAEQSKAIQFLETAAKFGAKGVRFIEVFQQETLLAGADISKTFGEFVGQAATGTEDVARKFGLAFEDSVRKEAEATGNTFVTNFESPITQEPSPILKIAKGLDMVGMKPLGKFVKGIANNVESAKNYSTELAKSAASMEQRAATHGIKAAEVLADITALENGVLGEKARTAKDKMLQQVPENLIQCADIVIQTADKMDLNSLPEKAVTGAKSLATETVARYKKNSPFAMPAFDFMKKLVSSTKQGLSNAANSAKATYQGYTTRTL